MRAIRVAAAVFLAAQAAACSRGGSPAGARATPSGNAVWFVNGFAGREAQVEAEASLARGGFSWVLVSSARIERRGGAWYIVKLAPPPAPITRLPVCLSVEGGADAAWALSSKDAAVRRSLEETLAVAARTVIADAARYGKVTGIHLDLPFTSETAESYGALVRKVRGRLPPGLFITVSLRFDPPPGSEQKVKPLALAADGLIAMVFGEHQLANPATADALGKPWWAGYAPGSEGRWTSGNGDDRGSLPESFLAALSDDPRLEFHHDLKIDVGSGLGYVFKTGRPLTVESRRFAAGDEVVFRQPSLVEMVRQIETDVARRRFARGRVFRLAGASDSERVFTLAGLNEILLGRSLVPNLRVSLERGKTSVSLSAENVSPLPSALSRTGNWIEVDLAGPGIRDVRPGGFDRYEIFAGNGRLVSLGRAVRVRFYETLLGPSEKIDPGVILFRRAVPSGCCRFRFHLLAASGTEFATDWTDAR